MMTREDRERAWRALHEKQILAIATATPAQRLAWLEEAIQLARAVGALPDLQEADSSSTEELSSPSG